jgi:hypothetical protein
MSLAAGKSFWSRALGPAPNLHRRRIRGVGGRADAEMSSQECRSRASGTGLWTGGYGPAAGAMGTDRNALAGHHGDPGCGQAGGLWGGLCGDSCASVPQVLLGCWRASTAAAVPARDRPDDAFSGPHRVVERGQAPDELLYVLGRGRGPAAGRIWVPLRARSARSGWIADVTGALSTTTARPLTGRGARGAE